MDREAQAFVASLRCHELDVVEIDGCAWSDPRFDFRSYRSMAYAECDPCRAPFGKELYGLAILGEVLGRVRKPHQALGDALALLRPGGSLLVQTSFLPHLHPRSPDLYRWTEEGLRGLLEEAGVTGVAAGSWGNFQCLAALHEGLEWTEYHPARQSLENDPRFPLAVWAFGRKPLAGKRVTHSLPHGGVRSFGVMMLTRNSAGYLERCLQSIVDGGFADEIVVGVDRETTDETAALARRFTPHVYPVAVPVPGVPESAWPEVVSHCTADYILLMADDETLGGNWDRSSLEALVRSNDLTHLTLPRRWLVPGPESSPGAPEDAPVSAAERNGSAEGPFRFLASEPWFPDYQVRFFRNDPGLLRWPVTIHDPLEVKGRGMILFDRWIEHYDLVLHSRTERQRKAQTYRRVRPEKHLSNFYLYEEQQAELLPADREGFQKALENFLTRRKREAARTGSPVSGVEIGFATGNNGAQYTREGWSHPEPWGRWTNGFRAGLRIPLERPFEGAARLAVESVAYVPDWHPRLDVRVVLNGETLGCWSVETAAMTERTLPVPAALVAGRRELLLEFHFDNPASPADSGEIGLDQRLLGLGVRRLRISGE